MSASRSACPRCKVRMQRLVQHGVVTLRCPKCGAVWYAANELARAIGGRPALGTLSSLSLEGDPGLSCSSCSGQLEERRAQGAPGLLVDVCARCHGVLLDRGEVAKLAAVTRELHSQRRRAVERARSADTQAAWASAVTAMATAKATRDLDELGDSPGVLRSLLMVLGLPVDAQHSADRPAWLVWGLILLLLAVFGLQLGSGDGLREWALVPSQVLRGEAVWTVFTSALLHGGLAHFAGNAYMLWMAGDNLEARLGSPATLGLYGVSGLAASAAVLATDPGGTVPYLGASGCIAGLLGAYSVMFPRSRVHVLPRWGFAVFRPLAVPAIGFFAFWFCLQLWGIWSGAQGIAFWAHIGGFAAGVVWGLAARKPAQV